MTSNNSILKFDPGVLERDQKASTLQGVIKQEVNGLHISTEKHSLHRTSLSKAMIIHIYFGRNKKKLRFTIPFWRISNLFKF